MRGLPPSSPSSIIDPLTRLHFLFLVLLPLISPVAAGADSTNQHPIDLETALRLAGANNPDIKIARQRLAEAKANRENTRWQFFPWVSAGLGYRRHDDLTQNVEGKILDVHKQSYSVGPTLIAQVDLGDAIYKNLASRQLEKAAGHALEAQRQDTLLSAALGYFDLAKATTAAKVAEESIRISTNYSVQVEQAVAAGLAYKGEELRVRVQTERSRLTLRQAQEQQRIASARLAQTLRLDPKVELVAKENELVPLILVATNLTMDDLLAQAVQARPELKQSAVLLEAARTARKGARYGALFPTVGAQVFVGGFGGGQDGDPHTFGASEDYAITVGWRLGPGGFLDRSRIRLSESRLQIAALSNSKLEDEIGRQVIESLTRVRSLHDQLATSRKAMEAAEATFRLGRERQEFGVGTVLENIQAEQELTHSRLDYFNAIAEFNKAQYALKRVSGSLSQLELPEEKP